MYLRSIIVFLVIATSPLCSQAQQRGDPDTPLPTKADAQRVVQTISGDTTKAQQYCEFAAIDGQLEQANNRKDTKKIEELFDKAVELRTKLGQQFSTLIDGIEQLDPRSKESQEVIALLVGLDKLCEKK